LTIKFVSTFPLPHITLKMGIFASQNLSFIDYKKEKKKKKKFNIHQSTITIHKRQTPLVNAHSSTPEITIAGKRYDIILLG